MKKIFISLFATAIMLNFSACSSNKSNEVNNDHSNTTESTYSSANLNSSNITNTIPDLSVNIQEITNYYLMNLEYVKSPHVSCSKSRNGYNISLQLDDEHCSYKKNYYPFAENAINITKTISKEYNIDDIFLIITFYNDSNGSVMWTTDDFGKSGIFLEEVKSANYENNDYTCSLNELKEKYKNFTE